MLNIIMSRDPPRKKRKKKRGRAPYIQHQNQPTLTMAVFKWARGLKSCLSPHQLCLGCCQVVTQIRSHFTFMFPVSNNKGSSHSCNIRIHIHSEATTKGRGEKKTSLESRKDGFGETKHDIMEMHAYNCKAQSKKKKKKRWKLIIANTTQYFFFFF